MSLKYLTRRTALNATTKNPALCNFNHLRSIPRAWLIRRSKHDPKLKSVRATDRIKLWNIVPGDQIRLRGDEDSKIHEVLSINRLSNRVFLKGPGNVCPEISSPSAFVLTQSPRRHKLRQTGNLRQGRMFITHDASSMSETLNCPLRMTLRVFQSCKRLCHFYNSVVFIISSGHVIVCLLRV